MKKFILLVMLISGVAKAQTFDFSCTMEPLTSATCDDPAYSCGNWGPTVSAYYESLELSLESPNVATNTWVSMIQSTNIYDRDFTLIGTATRTVELTTRSYERNIDNYGRRLFEGNPAVPSGDYNGDGDIYDFLSVLTVEFHYMDPSTNQSHHVDNEIFYNYPTFNRNITRIGGKYYGEWATSLNELLHNFRVQYSISPEPTNYDFNTLYRTSYRRARRKYTLIGGHYRRNSEWSVFLVVIRREKGTEVVPGVFNGRRFIYRDVIENTHNDFRYTEYTPGADGIFRDYYLEERDEGMDRSGDGDQIDQYTRSGIEYPDGSIIYFSDWNLSIDRD